MWRIWWASNNASKWQSGFNRAFNGLILGLKMKYSNGSLQNTQFLLKCNLLVHCEHSEDPQILGAPTQNLFALVTCAQDLYAHVSDCVLFNGRIISDLGGNHPWSNLRYYLGISAEGLKKAVRDLSQDVCSPAWIWRFVMHNWWNSEWMWEIGLTKMYMHVQNL